MEAIDQYVVIGNPIEHSKSPKIHTMFAEQTGEKIAYNKLFCPINDFSRVVSNFFAAGGCGANVTVPFKLEANNFAHRQSSRSEHAQAANTLINRGGVISAENTDGIGLVRDITTNLGFSLAGKSILIVGSGGAARGVLFPLLMQAPKSIKVVNRTEEKAHKLIRSVTDETISSSIVISSGGLTDLDDGVFDLVVNATSSSLSGELFPIGTHVLGPNALAYDMMYGKEGSSFDKWALQAKADHIADGLGMLVEQAAESFFLWRGKRPETKPVMEALRTR